MARPIKKTAEWYPHDSGIRNTPKMRALRHHQGNIGAIIYMYIWEYLLECDNQRTPYTEETLDVWSIDFNEDLEVIRNVVSCCIKYKMLQIDSYNNIYSEDLNNKLLPLFQKRTNDRQRQNSYRSENGSYRSENDGNRSENGSYRSENGSYRSENDGNRSENGSYRSENSNYRSENDSYRSENGSYRSDLKEQYIYTVQNSTMHSTSADIRAREAEGLGGMNYESSVDEEVDEEVKALQADQKWKEQVFGRFKFLGGCEQSLDKYLQMWAGEVKMRGRGHDNLNDAKEHLKNWLLVQEDKSKKQEKILAPLSRWQKITEKIGQSQTQSVVEQFSQLFFDSFNEDGKELIISAPSEDYARNIGANMNLLLNKVTEYFGKDVNLKFVYRNEK